MSDLVGNSKDRFSRDEAHILESSRNSFVDQVQLEGLVVGDSIERRESDKFPGRGHLARRFNQLHSDGTQSPKVSWRKVFFL